jgi:hypothetical protein
MGTVPAVDGGFFFDAKMTGTSVVGLYLSVFNADAVSDFYLDADPYPHSQYGSGSGSWRAESMLS